MESRLNVKAAIISLVGTNDFFCDKGLTVREWEPDGGWCHHSQRAAEGEWGVGTM